MMQGFGAILPEILAQNYLGYAKDVLETPSVGCHVSAIADFFSKPYLAMYSGFRVKHRQQLALN